MLLNLCLVNCSDERSTNVGTNMFAYNNNELCNAQTAFSFFFYEVNRCITLKYRRVLILQTNFKLFH